MYGNNSIELCGAQVIKALEYYLNEVVMKTPVKVTNVKAGHHDNGLVISITDAVEEEQADDPA